MKRFAESEVELDLAIKKFHNLATARHLYGEFVRLGAHNTFVELLMHENADISIDVIKVIKELLEEDDEDEEAIDDMDSLINAFVLRSFMLILAKKWMYKDDCIKLKTI